MQAQSRVPGQQAPVKIYNAVYSSVQVYECMVRGIAVMRRRADSYVNATQILKVAGVDKGRRTKILEKEILPGKHEIVQGGYGKYQGTWIPLERGRDIAMQYGVAPLLSPLFDFVPNTNAIGALPPGMPSMSGVLAPPPIMPGSALRLLNQGRAQGLFTPSTSTLGSQRPPGYASPGPYYSTNGFPGSASPYNTVPGVSPTPPPVQQQTLKRARSDASAETRSPFALAASPDIQTSRPASAAPNDDQDGPSPTKRVRTDHSGATAPNSPTQVSVNGVLSRPESSQSIHTNANGKAPQLEANDELQEARFATKATIPRGMDLTAPLRDPRRAAIVSHICLRDDPAFVLNSLREIPPDNPSLSSDIDLVLDDQGHTALHLAASLARHQTVHALLTAGSDIHRGNYNGETPLVRATLATANHDTQTFHTLVAALHASIRTLDTSKKSVVHHIVASAGVKGRALAARYYLEQIFFWIAQHQGGDFKSLVDIQDEHGDTALNVAARVGNRSLVRTLMDVGANRILANKLGLRPGDFGVETEELGGAPRAEDLLSSLRSGPSAPVQKSQDVLADIQTMIQALSSDFSAEIKSKQDSLDLTQAHLRAATRSLSEQRKQIQQQQAECAELDLITQRTRNLEKALEDEDNFDWTGRTELDGSDAGVRIGPGFKNRGPGSTLSGAVDLSFSLDEEPALPTTDSVASLIRLRRMKLWQLRMDKLMEERINRLKGASAEKEFQCKKIVSMCTGIPMDKVEDMLENLVVAVESESQVIDISRVSGFMQKVKNGVI
ncbi:transcription factor [Irpex rosettiformis]|uniref:Transcription factor n=1 Tax=Irpex rosettiformis TaxID=378272 RepID=A0ACB8TQZ6_9APHY|nr:transcription factor [Irpex rosettiformis]